MTEHLEKMKRIESHWNPNALGREPISIINYTQIVAFFLNHTVLVDSRVLHQILFGVEIS